MAQPSNFTKLLILLLISFSTLFISNMSKASHISFNVGVIEAYPMPVQMAWVPAHWIDGYWVPAQYVQYSDFPPAPTYVYMDNGYYPVRHWHRHHYYY